jgi:hypothetical protein
MKVEGHCHCGAIAYEADVESGTIGVCDCLDCQVLTGSAFRANILAPAEGFRILKGQPRRYIKTGGSAARRVHAFCQTCGSPVHSCSVEKPYAYSLRVGALMQREELGQPARQIWTKRRLSWITTLDNVPGVDGQP